MDRATIKRHVVLAERRIAEGLSRIERQRGMVHAFEYAGRDSMPARNILAAFEATQVVLVAEREQLLAELARADAKAVAPHWTGLSRQGFSPRAQQRPPRSKPPA